MVPKASRVVQIVASAALVVVATVNANGQEPPLHYRHSGQAPPGSIGSVQLQRGGPLPYYFQPIEIRAPHGAKVAIASQGQFEPPLATPLNVGLLWGVSVASPIGLRSPGTASRGVWCGDP